MRKFTKNEEKIIVAMNYVITHYSYDDVFFAKCRPDVKTKKLYENNLGEVIQIESGFADVVLNKHKYLWDLITNQLPKNSKFYKSWWD